MRTGLAAMQQAGEGFEYSDYLSRIDPRAVLDYYDAENAFEQTNTDGTVEIIHSCLLDRVHTHHANGDANPSAAMNLDKKTYVCYSYVDPDTGKSGYDIFHFIAKMEGKKRLVDIIPIITGFLDGAVKETSRLVRDLDRIFSDAAKNADHTHVPGLSERVLDAWGYTHPYIVERGVSLDTAERFRIGYDPQEVRITIPHFWGGRLVGWQKRAIPARPNEWPGTPNPVPKYRSSPGFPKGTTLYRYDDAQLSSSGRVVVVESPMSVIKADTLGLGINDPVVATFGSKVTDRQIELLRQFRRVVVWADPDQAGSGMEHRLVNALNDYVSVAVVTPDEGMDMGDYDDVDRVRDKIENATSATRKIMEWKARRGL